MGMRSIVLGGGCFWCVEGALKGLRGIDSIVPGYSGGHIENPSYEQVCGKKTGHAEVVRVIFTPEVIDTFTLLEVFLMLEVYLLNLFNLMILLH